MPHSHASPALFSSELAGHAQSDEAVDPVLTVIPPAGQGVQPTASPAPDLKVFSAQAEQVPLLPLPEKPATQT